MTILYFSATGNCLSVAKRIGGELLSIPKLVKENRYEISDDVIGVIAPTYCADIEARKKNLASVSAFDKVVDWLYHTAGAAQIASDRDKGFIVNDACIKCGTCAKVCPADNIRVTDHVEYLHHCEGCLGCLHGCPKNAIPLKNEQSAVRFRNAEVTLKELIDANN